MALLALTLSATWSPPAAAATTFDWSVPPRLVTDGDGFIVPHNTFAAANPATWPVDLDACQVTTASGKRSYRWTISTVTGSPVAAIGPISSCSVRFNAPQEGTYLVQLTITVITLVSPFPETTTYSQLVRVKDFLIVGMGDSAGSGEGNPHTPATSDHRETWQNARCHRSALSGQALAAKVLEDLDTKSSVTFVHVACSGATIHEGLLGPYKPQLEDGFTDQTLDSQVGVVKGIVGTRHIDAILVTVGINELKWGDLILACIAQLDCNRDTAGFDPAIPDPFVAGLALGGCGLVGPVGVVFCLAWAPEILTLYALTGTAAQTFADHLPGLDQPFADLANAFSDPVGSGGLGVTPSRVFFAGYPDPTRNEQGQYCDPADYLFDFWRVLPGISRDEFAWFGGTVVPGLNGKIDALAGVHGWTSVSKVHEAFSVGGYCAADSTRAIRRADESFSLQGDHHGMVHPNTRGHRHYRDRYMAFLRPVFGPVGDWTLSPTDTTVAPKERLGFTLDWKHHQVWRDLTTLELRFRDGAEVAMWVRWDETSNTFGLVDPKTGRVGPVKEAGGSPRLETELATLYLAGSTAQGSGPTGSSVAVTYEVSFKNLAAGREWIVEVGATDDFGAVQQFEEAGRVIVSR
jgi:hypothetical protein